MMFAVTNMRASRVNLLMNDFAAGLPSPLAFLGLAAAMAPRLTPQLEDWRWCIGVLPILHEVQISDGRMKPEMSPKEGRFAPVEIPEDLVGTVRVSMLMDVPGCDDEHRVAAALRGRRIAGGVLDGDGIGVRTVADDGRALADCPRGYAVVAPTDPGRRIVATGRIEDLQAVADILYPAERAAGAGWLVPVAVGHRLLEDPAIVPPRTNTRDPDIPHVFVEPAVGIAELVSVRDPKLIALDKAGLSDLLWRWTAEGDWILGHPNYHPNPPPTGEKETHHG